MDIQQRTIFYLLTCNRHDFLEGCQKFHSSQYCNGSSDEQGVGHLQLTRNYCHHLALLYNHVYPAWGDALGMKLIDMS